MQKWPLYYSREYVEDLYQHSSVEAVEGERRTIAAPSISQLHSINLPATQTEVERIAQAWQNRHG